MDTPVLIWSPADAAFAIGYLFGSIPFGLFFTWAWGGGDIRKIGSGNIGATNVLRTGRKGAAIATLLCDIGKGAAAVIFARNYVMPGADVFGALGAILGHLFPVWLGFKGGKGVATTLGVTLALDWRAGLLALATWIAVAWFTRISSLSALVAATLTPAYLFALGQPRYGLVAIFVGLLVFLMHHENINRLVHGVEPRIGADAPAHEPPT